MRIKIQDILLAFLLTVVAPYGIRTANAQDASFPGTEVDDLGVDKENEKMMYSPGELDPAFRKAQTSTLKDSMALKPVARPTKVQTPDASKTPVKRPSEEDDSILSFNFLYYIFQKYKMQDIVD
ncbi:MAG TPA: hypothetical protein VFD46_02400 [Chryseolinea sp.]|nr:hypothetical protein [Chryseolinea sp.]